MPLSPAARYRDRSGRLHHVVACQTRDGFWQVLDVTRAVRVVETLTGCDDGYPQAEAVARVYAADQRRRLGDDSRNRLAA